jgi:hypothetical protein
VGQSLTLCVAQGACLFVSLEKGDTHLRRPSNTLGGQYGFMSDEVSHILDRRPYPGVIPVDQHHVACRRPNRISPVNVRVHDGFRHVVQIGHPTPCGMQLIPQRFIPFPGAHGWIGIESLEITSR